MSEQLELSLPVEQSAEAELIKKSIEEATNLINSAEKIHRITMDTLRSRIQSLNAELKKKCTHPKTKIRDDYNYHHREEWKEEVCEECGLVLRRW